MSMHSSAIRVQIEAALAARIPSALTPLPRFIRPVSATGVDEVNELLNGGLPIGAISEFVGPVDALAHKPFTRLSDSAYLHVHGRRNGHRERHRYSRSVRTRPAVVTRSKFLLVEGPLQNQDNVIHIKATRLTALSDAAIELQSHDFH